MIYPIPEVKKEKVYSIEKLQSSPLNMETFVAENLDQIMTKYQITDLEISSDEKQEPEDKKTKTLFGYCKLVVKSIRKKTRFPSFDEIDPLVQALNYAIKLKGFNETITALDIFPKYGCDEESKKLAKSDDLKRTVNSIRLSACSETSLFTFQLPSLFLAKIISFFPMLKNLNHNTYLLAYYLESLSKENLLLISQKLKNLNLSFDDVYSKFNTNSHMLIKEYLELLTTNEVEKIVGQTLKKYRESEYIASILTQEEDIEKELKFQMNNDIIKKLLNFDAYAYNEFSKKMWIFRIDTLLFIEQIEIWGILRNFQLLNEKKQKSILKYVATIYEAQPQEKIAETELATVK